MPATFHSEGVSAPIARPRVAKPPFLAFRGILGSAMARPLRIEFPDALYHVTSRGNERRPIFRSDRDRKAFLEFLGEAARRFGWSITAWVLMTNHFHLVIQTPEPNLSRGMHWLNSVYAGWFNSVHRRAGHLFQGRFKSVLVDGETYFRRLLRYVVLNPVRAGIVQHPDDYRWSSYHITAGGGAPEWFDGRTALAVFDDDPVVAEASYRAFVDEGLVTGDHLWEQLVAGMYLGGDAWLKRMRNMIENRPRSTDHPRAQRAVAHPRMQQILTVVAQKASVTATDIRDTRGHPLRSLAAWLGWNEGLLTLRAIAAALRLRSEGHISNLIRRSERAFSTDGSLLALMDLSLATLRA